MHQSRKAWSLWCFQHFPFFPLFFAQRKDPLASDRTVFVTAALRLSVFFLVSFCPARAAAAATAAGTATACTAEMFSGFSILNLFVNQEQTISDHQNQNYCICHHAFLHVFWKRPDIRNVQPPPFLFFIQSLVCRLYRPFGVNLLILVGIGSE